MAQTEEDFNVFQEKNINFANGYYKENKSIPEKFLVHSFFEIIDNAVKKKENADLKYKSQIALYKRRLIAAASKHCEGFHRQLKKISKEKKVWNLTWCNYIIKSISALKNILVVKVLTN